MEACDSGPQGGLQLGLRVGLGDETERLGGLRPVQGGRVTVHVPPGRMQPIDSPMIFTGLAWRGGLPSDSVCDSLGTWNPKTNLT